MNNFDIVNGLQKQLRTIDFSGLFVIDELLHSGNNKGRFISGFLMEIRLKIQNLNLNI